MEIILMVCFAITCSVFGGLITAAVLNIMDSVEEKKVKKAKEKQEREHHEKEFIEAIHKLTHDRD